MAKAKKELERIRVSGDLDGYYYNESSGDVYYDHTDLSASGPLTAEDIDAVVMERHDEEVERLENASLEDLPTFEDLCPDFLYRGFCVDEECTKVHYILGVRCPFGRQHEAEDRSCPFVHSSVGAQREVWNKVIGCHIPEPFDNDVSLALMSNDLQFSSRREHSEKVPIHWSPIVYAGERPRQFETEDGEEVRPNDLDQGPEDDYEVADLEYWPDYIEQFCVRKSLWGPVKDYKAGCLFLDLFRARFNEGVICEFMRNYHNRLFADTGDEKERKLREMYHNRGVLSFWGRKDDEDDDEEEDDGGSVYPSLMMRSTSFASFMDTKENVLLLYRSTVREAAAMLNKLLSETRAGMTRRVHVFAPNISPENRLFSFAVLRDVLDWTREKTVRDHVRASVVVLDTATHMPAEKLVEIKEPSFMVLDIRK